MVLGVQITHSWKIAELQRNGNRFYLFVEKKGLASMVLIKKKVKFSSNNGNINQVAESCTSKGWLYAHVHATTFYLYMSAYSYF